MSVKLQLDLKRLGLDRGKLSLTAPEVKGFQPEAVFRS